MRKQHPTFIYEHLNEPIHPEKLSPFFVISMNYIYLAKKESDSGNIFFSLVVIVDVVSFFRLKHMHSDANKNWLLPNIPINNNSNSH